MYHKALYLVLYINDIISTTYTFYPIIYADATTLSATLNTFGIENEINIKWKYKLWTNCISNWLKLNKLSLNVNKTKGMTFHTVQRNVTLPNLSIDSTNIEFVDYFTFLGLIIDKHKKWNHHIDTVNKNISKTEGVMTKLKNFLPSNILLIIYNSLF